VRVCVHRRWLRASAHIAPEDDSQARLDSFKRARHAAAVRRFGTDLLSVRFDFAPA
jgi:hypothetical protein